MRRVELVDPAYADAVADVIESAAMLQTAENAATAAQKRYDDARRVQDLHAARQSAAYAAELASRIFSRARAGGLDGKTLLVTANLVLHGKRRLPDHLQPLEVA